MTADRVPRRYTAVRTHAALRRAILAALAVAMGCGTDARDSRARRLVDRALGRTRQAARSLGPTGVPDSLRPVVSHAIIGRGLVPVAAVERLGGPFAQYERDFVPNDERTWEECRTQRDNPLWACVDYYDRAAIYYVRYARTGDPKYLERANTTALDYRTRYLEGSGYGIAHYWSMMEGVALHYLTTGDTASLVAVGKVADNFAYHTRYLTQWEYLDNRFQAYWIRALLLAWHLRAPSTGVEKLGLPGGNDWAGKLREGLTNILASRDFGQPATMQGRTSWPAGTGRPNDGIWRAAQCGMDAGHVNRVHPFQVGLLMDALIRYYEQFEQDPRILPVVKLHADYLWANDWVAKDQGFMYVEPDCPVEGGSEAAPDLNQLIVNAYSWVYMKTGDTTYREKADRIFGAGVRSGGVTGDAKHFNQQYTIAYHYFTFRDAGAARPTVTPR